MIGQVVKHLDGPGNDCKYLSVLQLVHDEDPEPLHSLQNRSHAIHSWASSSGYVPILQEGAHIEGPGVANK